MEEIRASAPALSAPAHGLVPLVRAVGLRRLAAGALTAGFVLPVMTVALSADRLRLGLLDDVLLYLVAVTAVTVIGGFWPGVVAAVVASLALAWYFTPPVHTWAVDSSQDLLALLLFVAIAATVAAVVHVAAYRSATSRRSEQESESLLALARWILDGHDTPDEVLAHLDTDGRVSGRLDELVAGRWVRVAGPREESPAVTVVPIRPDLRLAVLVAGPPVGERVLAGYAAQLGAAMDRERLRAQASQAEALAAGNRMRTALLAAVGHDLRTPLAAVKAAVSGLRQTDVVLPPEDVGQLLATVEDNADRLAALIADLLDMSRLQTGAVQPLLRVIPVEEVVAAALRGIDGPVDLDVHGTAMVSTDPGLLERALANVISNAMRYSPPAVAVTIRVRSDAGRVTVDVVDHGPGVPASMRERIFEPFQQLGDRRTSGGVGLGLAVARGFVESTAGGRDPHGEPTPGGGLTMRVTAAAARVDVPVGS